MQAAQWRRGLAVLGAGLVIASGVIAQRSDPPVVQIAQAPPVAGERSNAAADAVEQLNVGAGLTTTLFASEPMMTNPSAMEVDHLSRVWICEAVNYRAFANADVIGRNRAADRVLVLEDTDRDGKADKSTVFHQGHDVDSAHGILVLPTPDGKGLRALVSAGDSVFFLIDDDGDLKSDRKELLFTGIGGTQHDHGIHAFHFGPDGKFYFNFGNEGKQIKDKNGQPITDKAGHVVNNSRQPYQEGMVFRCDIDGSNFETLAWNFRNNWELCVDPFGAIWQSDNDDDGNRAVRLNYVMEYGNYGYKDELTGAGWQSFRTNWEPEIPQRHWHLNDPGVVPNLIQTGAGAPTGITFYEGTYLPENLRGAVIHCDAGTSSVRAYVPRLSGAGYTVETVSLLDGSRNNWFRPSDVCVAPDGALYIADWYDPGVGGHRMRDVERGRVFRMGPNPAALVAGVPASATLALVSPNMSSRYLGWQEFEKFGVEGVERLKVLLNDKAPEQRARALWRLAKMPASAGEGLAKFAVRTGLSDNDTRVRQAALRMLRQVHAQVTYADVQDLINLNDPDSGFRREILICLRELPDSWFSATSGTLSRTNAWAQLAARYDGNDRWMLEALGITAEGRWNECLAAWLPMVGENRWQELPGARDIVWRSRGDRTPELIASLLAVPQTPAAEAPRFMRALDFQQGASRQRALESLAFQTPQFTPLTVRTEALARLPVDVIQKTPERLKQTGEIVDAARGTAQYITLVDRLNLSDRYPELLQIALKDPTSQLAADALRTLRAKRQGGLISGVLSSPDREKVEAALAALGTLGDRQAVMQLQEYVDAATNPLWGRQAAIRALGTSQTGARALLERARGEYPQELKEALAASLVNLPFEAIRRPALGIFPPPPGRDATPLPPLNVLVGRTGKPDQGRILFHTTGTCAKCHQINGIGVMIGPDLSEIGKKLAKPALYESILFPSAAISHNYDNWAVITDDGQVFSGLLVSETADAIELKEATGLVRKIPVNKVEERRKQDISLMPSDLQKLLTADELVDLVEYLSTLQVKKN